MELRCTWSGERSNRVVPISIPGTDRFGRPAEDRSVHVLPEHADQLRAFAALVQRKGRLFLGSIVALVLAALGAALLGSAGLLSDRTSTAVAGLSVAGLGILLVFLPFATPETVAWLGVRRSVRLARILGAVALLLGLLIAGAG